MFKSLVNGAKKLATGETGGTPISQLFPKVDPKVDGEDCLKDCDNCPTHYPRGFKIEEGDDLYGGVKGWSTHILVATGKADWTHNVADEKGSVMQAIEKADNPSNGVRKSPRSARPALAWPGPFPCDPSTGPRLTPGTTPNSGSCSPPPTSQPPTTAATTQSQRAWSCCPPSS